MAIPLAAFPGVSELAFFVVVNDAGGVEVERHPSRYPIEAGFGAEGFVAANWTA